MKIKNKIIVMLVIIVTLMNVLGISKATIEEGKTEIIGSWMGDIGYSYNGETKRVLIRAYGDNPVYTLKKSNEGTMCYVTELTVYKNEKIRNILKNGYACKTYSEIGCANIVEATIATQEAICIELERRNVDEYVIEDSQGERILNSAKKILENAAKEKKEEIEITSKDEYWKEYNEDNQYKYKEFTIKSMNTTEGNITIEKGENVKIIDTLGNSKQEFLNGDSFYLVVPKNIEQEVKIKLSCEKEELIVYTAKKEEEEDNKYILAEPGIEGVEKEFNVNVVGNSNVEITNKDQTTKEPIFGNVFSILNEDSSILKDNLTTDAEGKINITLDKGNYYLKQKTAIDGYNVNKALIEISIGNTEPVDINIESTKTSTQETTNVNKEINVTEENKNIVENNIKEEINITTTNINKEIINQTNQTNLNNVNNFINTINRKNVVNLKKENTYKNQVEEEFIQNKTINGENQVLTMTRQDYINYIDMLMLDSAKVPILPVASK